MNIERIREICLQLPHTFEGIKYGDQLCFSVGIPNKKSGGKVFCSSNIKNLDRINFKVPDEMFEELCEKEGVAPAPYGGVRFKYVQVAGFDYLTDKEWFFYIHQSYALLKADLPKKMLLKLV
jgi:predicted DNA-binding protein (MmcQ/YjbR family)